MPPRRRGRRLGIHVSRALLVVDGRGEYDGDAQPIAGPPQEISLVPTGLLPASAAALGCPEMS